MHGLFVTAVLVSVALSAEAASTQIEGFIHVFGECPHYMLLNWRGQALTTCRNWCISQKHCSSFLWMAAGNKHPILLRAQGCLMSLRQCNRREYINHNTVHHTYLKIGHKGMHIPGYSRYPGQCPGIKLINKGAMNHDQCAYYCEVDKKCKSFFLSTARYCKTSHEDCDGKRMSKVAGFMFVRTRHNLAFRKSAAAYYPLNAATLAVDGFQDNFIKQGSCMRTRKLKNPWFRVNLGGYHLVKSVAITNRGDCCSDKLVDFWISIKDDKRKPKYIDCAYVDSKFVGRREFHCEEPILGPWVAIRMKDMGMVRELSFCEIEVYASRKHVNELDNFEVIKKLYCQYHYVRSTHATSSLEECARICADSAECGAFSRYSTTCYFHLYGCEERTRTKHASFSLYIRMGHPGMEVPGFRHSQGGCRGLTYDIKNYHNVAMRQCAENCNKHEHCETFQWRTDGGIHQGYCSLSSKMMCDEPYNQGLRYHMFSRDMVNNALRKKSYQSTTYGMNIAQKATDGVLAGSLKMRTCSMTKATTNPWWAVDLNFNTRVKKVYINTERRRTLSGLKIIVTNTKPRPEHELQYVSGEVCALQRGSQKRKAKFSCKRSSRGRYVAVHQMSKAARPLVICEAVVLGFKNYDVHGYTEHDGFCTYMNIKTYKGLTPGDCADKCNDDTKCAGFVWYEDAAENYHCKTKVDTCDGKLTKKGQKKYPFRTYSKNGHPGLSIAGFKRVRGYYTTGYALKRLYQKNASPAICGMECNKNPRCWAITFGWTTYPDCYMQYKFPKTTLHKTVYYFTFLKEEPNIAINMLSYGVGRYRKGPVDGNTDGNVNHKSCYISAPKDGKSWWALNFGKPHYVNSVKIYNRRDCCANELKQLTIIVSDNKPPMDHDPTEVCAKADKPTTGKGKILKLSCRYPIAGQYLIIKKDGNEPLVMCEVIVNGNLWTDKNVALKKKTDSSSSIGTSLPTKAVDGKLNSNVGADTCAATRPSKKRQTTWWSVDLATVHSISAIKIQSRKDCCVKNLADFTVSVSTSKPRWNFEPYILDICNEKKGAVALGTMWSMRCRNPPIGQYVIVSQANEGESLTICEVQVFGRVLKLAKPLGFWPLTGGLKGADVIPGKGRRKSATGALRNVISRPGPLSQPYTAFTFRGGNLAAMSIPSNRKLAFKMSFTVMIYIYQSTSIEDGSIIEWDSGDLKLDLKNEKLHLHVAGRSDDAEVTSKKSVKPDRWAFVAATFDSKTGFMRVFIDDDQTEKNVGKRFRLPSISMDDIKVGFRGYKGGISCLQIYGVPMTLAEVIGARSRCKHYLKKPGDRAKNILKGMKAYQSSTWKDSVAKRAVDGDDAPMMWRKSCSSTAPDGIRKHGPHWWAVQLDSLRLITSVQIVNRLDCCSERLRNFRILVTTEKPRSPIGYDNIDVCSYFPNAMKGGQSKTFACREGGLVGQYVVVTKPDTTPLTLCEVEAYGDKVFAQPKRGQLFVWRTVRIDSVRRTEKKIMNEIANLKLCQRACLAENSFECRSIEFEYSKKRCRLYNESRRIRRDNTAIKAALDGTFVSQVKSANRPKPKPKPEKDLMTDVASLREALKKVEKTRNLLKKIAQDKSRQYKLIVQRITSYTKKLNELTSGTPKQILKPKGRNDLEQIARSPRIYSAWGSHDPAKKHAKCKHGKIKRWQSSTNWILNVAADRIVNGVKRQDQCEKICEDEVNFLCLSYAFSSELEACSMWQQNTATPGLDLIQKSGYTFYQWGCGAKPAVCMCGAYGDPHYKAFNGQTINHMGKCKYLASKPINSGGYCDFKIEQKNTGTRATWVILTDVMIFGHTFRFHKGALYIDGRRYTDLTEANRIHPNVQLTMGTIAVGRCQLWVKHTTGSLTIKLGKPYWGRRVEGWCGNCNGGAPRPYNFVKYEVVDDSGLGGGVCRKVKAPTNPCRGSWATKVSKSEYCGYFKQTSGPFGKCILDHRIQRNVKYANCRFDVCELGQDSEGAARGQACKALSNLAGECAKFGKPIKAWRNAEFCPLDCGRNMVYSIKSSGCPATCDNPDAPDNCDMSPREGCTCKLGYVLNAKRKCVVKEMCDPRSLADIVFLIDMSEMMGPKIAALAKDLVADIVDTIEISPKTTQVSVIPYCAGPWHTLMYHEYQKNRHELVEAIRNLPFCGGASRLPIALRFVKDKIFTPSLEKLRPSDKYMKFVVIINSADIAQDDAVVRQTQRFIRNKGKVFWIKYGSQTKPDPKGLTIEEYVFLIKDPKKVDGIVDTFNYKVFRETKCGLGFYYRKTRRQEGCADIDECRMDVCSNGDATCKNTKGGFKCECRNGFCFKPKYGCEEINECYRNPCLPGSKCLNTIGHYKCNCPPGYRYHTKRSCVDINECKTKRKLCKNGKCQNKPGSYACSCRAGLVYKKDVGCEAVDICKTKKPCKGIATCMNVHNGYRCTCRKGFKSDGKNGCSRINLCKKKPCKGDLSTCRMKSDGVTFECLCPNGYQYKKKDGCERIDPCLAKPCLGFAQCTSDAGKFYCGCPGEQYYNEKVGCEYPEERTPQTKLVVLLDDSADVGKKDFKILKDSTTKIALAISDKSKTLNMGVVLMGGKPKKIVPNKKRPIYDYDELIQDIDYDGGNHNVQGALNLLKTDKDLTGKSTQQVIIVVITKKNMAYSKLFDPACQAITKKNKAKCHHMILLYGNHREIVDPKPGTILVVPSVVELFTIDIYVKEITTSWMSCEKGFVHDGSKCRKETTVVYQCVFNGEHYSAEAVWTTYCVTYKCLPTGARIINAECRDVNGKCHLANGIKKFKCMSKRKIYDVCTCTVKYEKHGLVWSLQVKQKLKPKPKPVITFKGNAEGKACHFPFRYRNQVFKACTDAHSDISWCSVTKDLDLDGLWGYCKAPKGKGKCLYGGKEYIQDQQIYNTETCTERTCHKDGTMRALQDSCRTLDKRCMDIGSRDYPCDINGYRYETCACVGVSGRAKNVAYTYVETVGAHTIGKEMCVINGTSFPMGKGFRSGCDRFKCEEGHTLDKAKQVAYAKPVWLEGDCEHDNPDGKKVCVPVNKTKACAQNSAGKAIDCTCKRNEAGIFHLSYAGEPMVGK